MALGSTQIGPFVPRDRGHPSAFRRAALWRHADTEAILLEVDR